MLTGLFDVISRPSKLAPTSTSHGKITNPTQPSHLHASAIAVLSGALVGFVGDALAEPAGSGSGTVIHIVLVSWIVSARDDLSLKLLLLGNDM